MKTNKQVTSLTQEIMNTMNPSDSEDIDAIDRTEVSENSNFSLTTEKMPNIIDHPLYISSNQFRELEGEEPLTTNVLPLKQQIEIKGWCVHLKYGEFYMPMIEREGSPALIPHLDKNNGQH